MASMQKQNTTLLDALPFECCTSRHIHEKFEDVLDAWHNSDKPRYVDLVSDFAGQEFFILDGEALLQNIFCDPMLDLGGTKGGFQILHCIYLVERFLLNLTRRRCVFAVVFFENFENISCVSKSFETMLARRLARKVIIQHIESHLAEVEMRIFPTFDCPEFEQYLASSLPYFIMTHNGPYQESVTSSGRLFRLVKVVQRGLMYLMNLHRIATALIGQITFTDTKILTFVSEPAIHLTTDDRIKHDLTTTISHAILTLDHEFQVLNDTLKVPSTSEPFQLPKMGNEVSISRKSSVTAMARYLATIESNPYWELSYIFLLHLTMLENLSLQDRAQSDYFGNLSPVLNRATHSIFLPRIYSCFYEIDFSDGADIMDGRLFSRLVWEFTDPKGAVDLNDPIFQQTQSLWSQLTSGRDDVKLDFHQFRKSYPRIASPPIVDSIETSLRLTEFRHPNLSQYLLDPILTKAESSEARVQEDENAVGFRSALLHTEDTHWHSGKPIMPHPGRVAKEQPNKRVIARRKRADQLSRASMQRYAESLSGQEFQKITIITDSARKSTMPTKPLQNTHSKTNAKSSKKPPVLPKGQQMILENQESKLLEKGKKADLNIKGLDASLKRIGVGNLEKKVAELEKAIHSAEGKKDVRKKDVRLVTLLHILKIREHISEWESQPSSRNFDTFAWIPVEIYRSLQVVCASTYSMGTTLEKITSLLQESGLPIPPTNAKPRNKLEDETLPFTFMKKSKARIPYSPEEFQLRFCAPFMEKALDAMPDERVQFVPDGWQRRVLDILDKNESVIAVAPTSAGKTFIAYYAMEKILRADNSGVLVYIAPTKALVNQIGAEISARFSKNYPSIGTSIWAIHTRDHRINNPYGCQILVTVPEMLQILLLSPQVSKAWAPRLRRIIFDEVHSIGNLDGGVVWEQLLLTTTVPLIALSATVGNAQEFQAWLSSVQASHGTSCHLVVHPYRYSHLQKFTFYPKKAGAREFTGLGQSHPRTTLESYSGFDAVHPYAALAAATGSFPPDLQMDAADCWELYSAMASAAREGRHDLAIEEVKALRPEIFFKSTPYIKIVDVIRYESFLRKTIESWIALPAYKEVLNSVISTLGRSTKRQVQVMEASYKDESPYEMSEYQESLLLLLDGLNSADALPALVFHFERHGIETMARRIVKALMSTEEKFKSTDKAWQQKCEAWRKWQSQAKAREKQEQAQMKAAKAREKEELAKDKERSQLDDFDPAKPLPQFSFQSRSKTASQELEEHIEDLQKWANMSDWMANCLRRGIGIHHAGLNRKYRQLVETLFREGTLRVVIATGTLALGINVPCRTVIFAGDSVFLTALNYRQCSGRAGRRGFDPVGNVVFHGIPLSKVYRLLVSRIPDLVGHFPITTTLVSRLLGIITPVGDEGGYGPKAVGSLLKQSRVSFGSEHSHQQVLHHFRFSIEYLLRQNLVNSKGECVALSGLINHLYFTEPSNFALAVLLRSGVFHRICSHFNPDKPDPQVLISMIHILSHLFGRRIRKQIDSEHMRETIKRSSSMVILQPLPEDAVAVLTEHNAEVVEIYRSYAIEFGRTQFTTDEKTLPMSELTFETPSTHKSSIIDSLRESAIKYDARSAFVAMSGHGDTFDTIIDLARNTREGILIESEAVPSMDDFINPPILDAYILDFYKHGQVDVLVNGNGISRSEVWYLLDAFDRILGAIDESLKLVASGVELDFEGNNMTKTESNPDAYMVWEDEDDEGEEGEEGKGMNMQSENELSLEDFRVCAAFSALRVEFHLKFKSMWA